VQNRRKAVRIFAQHAIETVAASLRQYFTAVMLAYSCHLVGIENSTFKKIQASEEFDATESKKSPRQICKTKVQPPEAALVSHMMNRQHRFERQALRADKYGGQRCRPIVHVQNLHLWRQSPG
jgi:hypothetical protein